MPTTDFDGDKTADGKIGPLPDKRPTCGLEFFPHDIVAPPSNVARKQNQRVSAQAGNPGFPTKPAEAD